MPLLSIEDLSIGFRGPQLLDGVSSKIDAGQRIGLLGRNGAGKTTLLRILCGEVEPDGGKIVASPNVRVERLTQDVPDNVTGSIQSVVLAGQPVPSEPDQEWRVEHAVETTLSKMQLDGDLPFENLSSGMKRRVLLASAIALDPDILLLDEPTNHLDIPSIQWLEDFLLRWKKTLIFVTHDRAFLQKLATRIWEIDRGRLFDWSCDYATFLQRKEQALAAEDKQNALFDKKLAEEEAWIRQGIKARRTRNEGRVRALKAMREKRRDRRSVEGKAKLNWQEAARSGALVADVQNVSFSYGDHVIMSDFSTTLMRGDKVGIIGRNGAGKTTLLRILLGQLQPQSGIVRTGTNLQVAYFDQLRHTLDPHKTVQENVGGGTDRIQIGDKTKHILGYLQDFLFTPERARTEVRFLSGGERNRAMLARLMTQPANVLVMDEPTNDLDSETLELLEEQLAEFTGTLLLVSHDRTFLNRVVTSTIVFEENGIGEYVGGYDEWQAAVRRRNETASECEARPAKKPEASEISTHRSPDDSGSTRKLSYKEQTELRQLPSKIESLESEIAELHSSMSQPDYFQSGGDKIAADAQLLKQKENDLKVAYERWEQLES